MTATATPEKGEFQAEVGQVLDIVINSLYTDKEIFVRELVSNASDALEKLRHLQLTEGEVHQPDAPLEIRISADGEAGTVTIADRGLGMTREELKDNLGTIARSGSKAFLEALEAAARKESSLIGQFGVGFYSAFMVADRVVVETRSWRPDGEGLVWSSDGKEGYEISPAEQEPERGCRITLHLREDCKEFADEGRIRGILESYSSFVPFPVLIGEERVNTVEALWRKRKNEISEDEYKEFYKFTAKAFDEPLHWLHFQSETPLELNALLFVPGENTELWGFGQMEPGVALYCKNVLIDDRPEGLLPEWLRFLRGVIDSADIPLNISRESMQDSALVQKLNRLVTKRFLKFLDAEAREHPDEYKAFYGKFGRFLKEGAAVDFEHREALAKLLRFESSLGEAGELVGFEDYLARAKEGQDKIYYLVGENRASLEAGPYLEAFRRRGLEVLYLCDAVDEFLLQHLREFDGRALLSAASAAVELGEEEGEGPEGEPLAEEELGALCDFLKEELGDRVEKVSGGRRLVEAPAAVLLPENAPSPQMLRMMKAMNPDQSPPPLKVELELNPRHELVRRLSRLRESDADLARLAAEHLLDNALLAAGLLEDRAAAVERGFRFLEAAMGGSEGGSGPERVGAPGSGDDGGGGGGEGKEVKGEE